MTDWLHDPFDPGHHDLPQHFDPATTEPEPLGDDPGLFEHHHAEDAPTDDAPEPVVEPEASSYSLEHESAAVPFPDVDPLEDGSLPQSPDVDPFPPHLDVDVAPADGHDWTDPALLGDPESPDLDYDHTSALTHLAEAEGADPAGSEDPAVRALARFWAS